MGAIYLLTLRQLVSRGRIAILVVLAALPVVFTWLVVASGDAPSVSDFELVVLNTMLAGAIAPLMVLAIAGPAFSNEIEDRTLANLTLAPISRWRIVVPKLLATISVAGVFVGTSAFVTGHMAYLGDPGATAAVTAAMVIEVALYASAFVWLGLVSTHAIGFGLVYVVLWEGFFTGFVPGVKLFSIRQYAIAWMHGLDARRFAEADPLGLVGVVVTSVVVCAGFLALSVRRLKRMDVP